MMGRCEKVAKLRQAVFYLLDYITPRSEKWGELENPPGKCLLLVSSKITLKILF